MATQLADTGVRQGNKPAWGALVFLALAQFMVVLDGTIVNLAIPRLQAELGIGDSTRSWLITAYALAFGALLLLGGRIADFWGRKRTFIVAGAGFALASLVGGIAQQTWELLASRALQGMFAALLAPAALALLTVAFPAGKDRGTAFAVFGSISGAGAAVGVLLGGFLTEYVSWRWCFFINVPIAAIAVAGAWSRVRESKAGGSTEYDWPGVVLASFLSGAVLIGGILFINFYIQIVLGFAPFMAGLASLPMTVALIITAAVVAKNLPALGAKVPTAVVAKNLPAPGAKIPTAVGPLFMAAAMLWLTQVSADGSYAAIMLPALVLMGMGLGMVFVPMQNLALFGVDKDDSGVASALVSASQQIGGSLGIAVFSTIAAAATAGASMTALSTGYAAVFLWAAGVAVLIVPVAVLLINIDRRTFSGTEGEAPVHLG